MAGHDDAQWISADRRCHSTHRARLSNMLAQAAIAEGLSVRQTQKRSPNSQLEGGAEGHIQGQLELDSLAGKIGCQALGRLVKPGAFGNRPIRHIGTMGGTFEPHTHQALRATGQIEPPQGTLPMGLDQVGIFRLHKPGGAISGKP